MIRMKKEKNSSHRTLWEDVSIVHATREPDDEIPNSSLVITDQLQIDRVAVFPVKNKLTLLLKNRPNIRAMNLGNARVYPIYIKLSNEYTQIHKQCNIEYIYAKHTTSKEKCTYRKKSPVHGRFLNEYDSRPVNYSNAVPQPMLLVKSCRYLHPASGYRLIGL